MTSFLITKKDNKSYEEKLSSAPESTKRNKVYAVQALMIFTGKRFHNHSKSFLVHIYQNTTKKYIDCFYLKQCLKLL